MRYLAAALLALAACTEVAVDPPARDAGPDVASPDAAEPDAPAPYCSGVDAATSCTFSETPCGDGGVTYECGGLGCPSGTVGSCTLLEAHPQGFAASFCCERKACVRMYDSWCNGPDGGAEERWFCPYAEGDPDKSPRPPGKCRFELGTPARTATAAQICCLPPQ